MMEYNDETPQLERYNSLIDEQKTVPEGIISPPRSPKNEDSLDFNPNNVMNSTFKAPSMTPHSMYP